MNWKSQHYDRPNGFKLTKTELCIQSKLITPVLLVLLVLRQERKQLKNVQIN